MGIKTNIVTATLIVVAIGVAMYLGSALSGIGSAISKVADAVVSTVSFQLGGVSNLDSLTLGDDLVVDKTSTLTGTTTITQSIDGLVFGGTFSMAATGTVRTLDTNSTGPKLCDASTAYLFVQNNGSFAPSLVFSLGTSTASALASTNLVASSTVSTTTTTLIPLTASLFRLAQGETLTAIFGDITNTEASSTYFSRWTAQAGVWCQDMSI